MASEKVCLVGSGNWGSAIARIVGNNVVANPLFDNEVAMWVYEEQVEGQNLTEIINTRHENVKYLPGVPLPENVVAVPDIAEAVRGATVLIFVVPHQFLPGLLRQIRGNLHPRARGLSLIKGIDFDENGIKLISNVIRDGLGIDVSVLMGANVANEVAQDQFCESTIGTSDPEAGSVMQQMLNAPSFSVSVCLDPIGVELCGALKNVVALGAGFCDGLDYGGNTKAAIIRLGLREMQRFCKHFYEGIRDDTFMESCGVADLITTCYGGRNRKCAEAFVRTGKSWDVLEAELLGGQKLQGTLTSGELNTVLGRAGVKDRFPFFDAVYKISFEGQDPRTITQTQVNVRDSPQQSASL